MHLAYSLLLIALLPVSAQAADEQSYDNECHRWADTPIPNQDIGKATADCDTTTLYYGIDGKGKDADFPAARHCAYQQRASGEEMGTVFGGSGVLAMIYANGRGVKRNLPLAKRFACEYGGAPAEIGGRLHHLDELANDAGDATFDLCDDITSGMMMGFCAGREADFARAPRAKRWAALQADWTPAQQSVWVTLRKAADEYFEHVASEETDMSGSARGMFAVEARETLDIALLDDMERFEKGLRPSQKAAELTASDKALNRTYKQTLAKLQAGSQADDIGDYGSVNADGVRTTQRSWLLYRDAWVRFANLRYPKTPADAWKAWLTVERTRALAALVADP